MTLLEKYTVVVLLILLPVLSKSQDYGGAATTAPSLGFSLPDGQSGTFANSVNLFNGEVNLPVSLASVGDIDISATYSTMTVEETFGIWNKETPTGILGLGWNFLIPQIMVDNKMTGTRHDDDFYLLDKGMSSPLVITAISSGIWYFKTAQFSNWVIKYIEARERWEVLKEDGTLLVFGDGALNRSTLQYQVKWGNWIGSSNLIAQQRHVIAWNLAEVKNLWDHTIMYTYENVEENVLGPQYYTKASYLKRVSDNWGNYCDLQYDDKIHNSEYVIEGDNVSRPVYEYEDPHSEQAEPDAYQERFETRYLKGINVYTPEGLLYETKLSYRFMYKVGAIEAQSGFLWKRFLTSVEKVSIRKTLLWHMGFRYSSTDGYLTEVDTNEGGTVRYAYTDAPLDKVLLNVPVEAPPADSDSPSGYSLGNIYFQENYVVTLWRAWNGYEQTDNLSKTKIKVYTWDGRWFESTMPGMIYTGGKNDHLTWGITFQKDFFAIVYAYLSSSVEVDTEIQTTKIFKLSNKKSGEWISFSKEFTFSRPVFIDFMKTTITSGNQFVGVSIEGDALHTFVQNGTSGWKYQQLEGGISMSGRNNFIIVHTKTYDPDRIIIHYLDQFKKWKTRSTVISGLNQGNSTSAIYASNTTAMLLADGNEFLLSWDENYAVTAERTSLDTDKDKSRVMASESSILSIGAPGQNDQKINAYRFVGGAWRHSDEKTHNHKLYLSASISAGDDVFSWHASPSANNLYMKTFNPNNGIWEPDKSLGISSTQYANFGINFFSTYNACYYKDNKGIWNLNSNPNLTIQAITSPYYAVSGSMSGISYSRIDFLKNGILNGYFQSSGQVMGSYKNEEDYPQARMFLAGSSSFATYDVVNQNHEITKLTKLMLFKFIDYEVDGKKHHKRVTNVTFSGAEGDLQSVAIDYAGLCARYDPSEKTAQYGMVLVYPVNSTSLAEGHTNYFFFNGYTESDLNFEMEGDGNRSVSTTNLSSHLELFTGQLYRTAVYDNTGAVVSVTDNTWNVKERATAISDGISHVSYFPQITSTSTKEFGMKAKTTYGYHTATEQLISKNVVTTNPDDSQVSLTEDYTYYWMVYDPSRYKNLLTPVVQQLTKRNGVAVESTLTTWKDWSCQSCGTIGSAPSPWGMYEWNYTSTPVNTDWINPSNQIWKKNSTVLSVDAARGIPIEVASSDGRVNSSILYPNKAWLLAGVENARLSDVYVNSFEHATQNISYESKTGTKSYLGAFNIILPHAGTFKLTYWKKNGTAPWEFVETSTNTNVIIGGTNILIDEVRIFPDGAKITSRSYDRHGNITSTCDSNNLITYQEYDDKQRKVLVRDKDRNILEYYQYNTKVKD